MVKRFLSKFCQGSKFTTKQYVWIITCRWFLNNPDIRVLKRIFCNKNYKKDTKQHKLFLPILNILTDFMTYFN